MKIHVGLPNHLTIETSDYRHITIVDSLCLMLASVAFFLASQGRWLGNYTQWPGFRVGVRIFVYLCLTLSVLFTCIVHLYCSPVLFSSIPVSIPAMALAW